MHIFEEKQNEAQEVFKIMILRLCGNLMVYFDINKVPSSFKKLID